MKKIKILYWVFTGLFAAFMISTAIPNIMINQQSIDLFAQLGYPKYLIGFIGWLKLLGAIAILVPGFPRVKEWAYAGLFYDLMGATYSSIAAAGFMPPMLFMIVPFALEALSYIYYHKTINFPSSPLQSRA
ncbi:MAG TPA: DoxX family protein [Chryseolinea sp.]|nr:DoxX family protein [Chryseolinea sp.]